MLIPVLQDQISLRVYQTCIQYLVRNRLKSFQGVWRVCEYYVELLFAERDEIEYVVMHGRDVP